MPSPSTAVHRPVGSTTQVDGVPVLFASAPGPLRAALVFRVGPADEHLAIRGITHLVEHLALSGTPVRPHTVPGLGGNAFTTFTVSGDDETVVTHLRSVCARLSRLPVRRLEHERGALRLEAVQHARPAVFRSLAVRRWGARDHGLCGWDEVGVAGLTAAQVSEWAECGFTRGNAVLCLSGPPPAGLHLPLGAPVVGFDVPTVAIADDPRCYTDSDRHVALSYLAPHGAAGRALAWVVSKRLTNRLRAQLGSAYGVQSLTDRLDAEHSLYTFVADCAPDTAAAVQAATTQTLLGLLSEPVTDEELADVRRLAPEPHEVFLDPQLTRAAQRHLLGTPARSARAGAPLREMTAQQIAAAAREALSTLLLAVPDAASVPVSIAAPVDTRPAQRLSGPIHLPSGADPDNRATGLVRSLRGLSLLDGEQSVTVAYDKVAAVLCYDDGTRALVDDTGLTLHVVPKAWHDVHLVLDDIDTAIHPSHRIPAGPRPAPAPPPRPERITALRVPTQARAGLRRRVHAGARTALRGLRIAAVVVVVGLVAVAADRSTRAWHPAAIVAVPALTAALAASFRRTRHLLPIVAAVALGAAPTAAAALTLGATPSPHVAAPRPAVKTAASRPNPVAATAYQFSWPQAGFSASFPSRPTESQDQVTTGGVSVTVHEAMWSSGSRSLDVGATKMPPSLQVTGTAVPEAACANSVSTAHGTDVTTRWVTGGTHPVRETWFSVQGQRSAMRCFVSGQTLYTIAGTPSEYQSAVSSFRALS